MARDYNGSTDRGHQTYSGLTARPIFIFARVMGDSQSLQSVPFAMTSSAHADSSYAILMLGSTTDKVSFRSSNGTNNISNNSTASYVAGTWHSIAWEMTAANNRLYLDAAVISGGNYAFPNGQQPNTFSIGAHLASGGWSNYHDGKVASFAVWHGYTGDFPVDSVVALHKGFSPRRVYPSYLKAYRPLVRGDFDLRDVFGAVTEAGSPAAAEHPRIYGGY
jgi:hypothetical protein